ncbi:class I SAM-dependent methyltransferase [Stappia sp. MMSF_3263]|mgnify:CR=1 FL=1|uniref:class I SAM-dependent methyltransferase n=1 Tax=Stappia sp. MMSF_3263 TaxID=3046693 RepID=UPI00273D67E8|nr:class I SAM-dependent methyltransferase [Stappia sp. MMSF_3263]
MSRLYLLKRRFQRKLPESLQRKFQEAIYFALYRLSPARHQNFFNSGFSPADETLSNLSPFDQEPLQATLYDQVLWSLTRDAEKREWNDILDIGCGLGGGMQVAARRFPDARITGVDVNGSAVSVCRKRLQVFPNLTVKQASARELPFADASFDMIFSVGTASYVGMPAFVAEAARVLRPGGTLSFSLGYTDKAFANQIRVANALARENGLRVQQIVDITKNVFAAIAEDVPRRLALIDRVPGPFRGYALDWADMPGTMRYQEYVEGRRLDYAVVCERI